MTNLCMFLESFSIASTKGKMATGLDAFESLTLFFMMVAWWANPFDMNGTSYTVMQKRYRKWQKNTRLAFIPGGLFGPVWFILYTLIAFSLWAYFNYSNTEKHDENHHLYSAMLSLMLINYVTNKLWTTLFFTMENYVLGVIDSILIFVSALALTIMYWFSSATGDDAGFIYVGGALLIPYTLWAAYAMLLSMEIAYKNRSSMNFKDILKLAANADNQFVVHPRGPSRREEMMEELEEHDEGDLRGVSGASSKWVGKRVGGGGQTQQRSLRRPNAPAEIRQNGRVDSWM